MLSRVAAVKAPRTHNRRRVTGSSGRRREGGESEPQRPNMSRHLFYSAVLLLVVMVCCGSGEAAGVAEPSSVSTFEWRGINESGGETVDSLGAPSLLKVGNDVFAVAEAQCKKKEAGDVSFTGVASQPLTTETAETPVEVLKNPEDETQVLEKGASDDAKKKVDVSRPTTVLKGNDIYMLVGAYNKVASSGQDGASDAAQLGLLLVKESVDIEDENNKKIDWEVIESSPQGLFGAQLDSWTKLIGSGGSGVKMKDETLVFPVEGTKKAAEGTEEGVKTVSLIIYSSTDNKNLKLSKGMSDGGCSDPSVVEWEEGKLMMMTACAGGPRRVYEIGDKGESWTEALGTLSRVWGNNKKDGQATAVRSGFITATVGNDGDKRNVMLVTLPVYAEEGNEKGKLHLWLTDNTHIVDIGPVSGEDDDAAASSLLYNSGENTNDEKLIALYEKKKKEGKPSPGMVSVLLTEKLKRVKEVLATWKEVDGRVSNLCTSLIAEKDPPTGDVCGADKITAGLVGFLSGNFSENVWRDEYLGVNATVNNKAGAAAALASTKNGVKFTGRGAGAEWPVGKQGENQLYHFANYNFTLVATVSIDKMPEEGDTPIPLVGVRAGSNGENKLMELSYDSGKKWHVLCGDKTTTKLSSTWETGTPQHVVVLLKNSTQGSVYVDGQRVGNEECALGNGASNEISHFYIGGDGENAANKEVSVTVTNVLLYNRPLDEAEITALNPNKDPTSPVTPNAQKAGTSSALDGSHLTERGQSMGSSGVNGGGASPSAVPTVSTPSAGKDSLQQVASGKSSDGTQTVDGGSFSDGEPTVETREGGADGREKEEIHAQNGDVKAAALSSSLGNVSQGNNSDAGTMCESGLLPSLLLLLLLGLWGFVAL
ncbi:putative trans-sialidase, Group V [Trypanosoma cruzi]|uniref:Trans-sialidase, putative n=2 Tax=Trypanosoma cruzi TaxID=5693 RepID=Q4DBZ5_TRYCC|nr:trans-sialidase, putative [Trypanosoma cruzi]EAN90046.1 trans-sialidase, putative [Trypanosoma cruzi]PWV20439.1 putative trans-sialidase, Group V [Trypanosoma cruzi]|eukprot:XP_811897.1 trans-sialidase [Trypanosoma cruzi strain CL Brener]